MTQSNDTPTDNVTELPAGPKDVVRVLRFALREAERGHIDHVVMVCNKNHPDDGTSSTWSWWSDMTRHEVLWFVRWLMKYVDARYFHTADGED